MKRIIEPAWSDFKCAIFNFNISTWPCILVAFTYLPTSPGTLVLAPKIKPGNRVPSSNSNQPLVTSMFRSANSVARVVAQFSNWKSSKLSSATHGSQCTLLTTENSVTNYNRDELRCTRGITAKVSSLIRLSCWPPFLYSTCTCV